MRQRNDSRILHAIVVAACALATLTGCAGLVPNADMALITSFDDATRMAPGTAAVEAATAGARADTDVGEVMEAPADRPIANSTGDASADLTPLAAAVARWRRCVARQFDGASLADTHALGALRERHSLERRIERACEGHRRDVALHYPRHLENRVIASLNRQERRLGAVHERALDGGRTDLVGALDSAFRALEGR